MDVCIYDNGHTVATLLRLYLILILVDFLDIFCRRKDKIPNIYKRTVNCYTVLKYKTQLPRMPRRMYRHVTTVSEYLRFILKLDIRNPTQAS